MTTAVNSPDPGDEDTSVPVIPIGITYARVLQLVKQHGFTGLIIALLAYQLGWIGASQSYMCGM